MCRRSVRLDAFRRRRRSARRSRIGLPSRGKDSHSHLAQAAGRLATSSACCGYTEAHLRRRLCGLVAHEVCRREHAWCGCSAGSHDRPRRAALDDSGSGVAGGRSYGLAGPAHCGPNPAGELAYPRLFVVLLLACDRRVNGIQSRGSPGRRPRGYLYSCKKGPSTGGLLSADCMHQLECPQLRHALRHSLRPEHTARGKL